MIHNQHGLMLFSDVQPSEQLSQDPITIYCFLAVMCLDPKAIQSFKQYKATEAGDRPQIAKELADILRSNESIRAIGFVGTPESIEKFGKELLATVPEKTINRRGKKYKIGKKKVDNKAAEVLPWFSVCLLFMGLRAANWAKQLKQTKVTLVLDKLPASPETSMEMVRRISHHPELFPLWKDMEEAFGVSFHITNMQNYHDEQGNTKEADEHPCMVLADWLAHSMFAASNKPEELDGIANRDEEYRTALAAPWLALYECKRFDLLPVNNLTLSDSNTPSNKALQPTPKIGAAELQR